jgi:hypothetical protein
MAAQHQAGCAHPRGTYPPGPSSQAVQVQPRPIDAGEGSKQSQQPRLSSASDPGALAMTSIQWPRRWTSGGVHLPAKSCRRMVEAVRLIRLG